jgi:hypothetical protein
MSPICFNYKMTEQNIFVLSVYGSNECIVILIFKKKKKRIDFLDESGLFIQEKQFLAKKRQSVKEYLRQHGGFFFSK